MKELKQISQEWWQKQTTLSADRTSFEAGYNEAMKWIPIEDELPPLGNKNLIVKWIDNKGCIKYGMATYFDFYSLGLSKFPYLDFIIQGSCKREVTHWKPL